MEASNHSITVEGKSFECGIFRGALPRNITWNPKMMVSLKGISFSRDFFSGSMLDFRGVSVFPWMCVCVCFFVGFYFITGLVASSPILIGTKAGSNWRTSAYVSRPSPETRETAGQGMFLLFLVSLQGNQKVTCGQEKNHAPSDSVENTCPFFWDDEQYKNVTEIQRLSR